MKKPEATRRNQHNAVHDVGAIFALVHHHITYPKRMVWDCANPHRLANLDGWLHRPAAAGNQCTGWRLYQLAKQCPSLIAGNHLTILRGRSIPAQPLKTATLIATLLCTSCAFDTSVPSSPSEVADAAGEAIDASPISPDAALDERHLLLSEVQTKGSGKEFIEIYNPRALPVDLSDYYIADTQEYALLPGAFGDSPAPSVGTSDFIARFPEGAIIDGQAALILAIRPVEFRDEYGTDPDFRIGGEPSGQLMREAHGNSIDPLLTLTDSGEGIALFYWDQSSDLVTDVDLIDVGPNTSAGNRLADKSGVQVDGPDSGTETSEYLVDLGTMTSLGVELDSGQSFHRIRVETDHEGQDGAGNGQHGHDETTEDIRATWGVKAATPGTVAVEL